MLTKKLKRIYSKHTLAKSNVGLGLPLLTKSIAALSGVFLRA